MSVDWGDVRIGLALSDESQVLASPLETLVRRPGKRFPIRRTSVSSGDARIWDSSLSARPMRTSPQSTERRRPEGGSMGGM